MNKPKQTRASESADPHELNNPVPRVLLGLIAALLVWAVYYIFVSSPNSVAALGDQRNPATLVAATPAEGGAIDGKQIFTAACQACHQATGQGLPGVFPPLAGVNWVTGDPEVLARIVLHGMTGPITVSNTTYNGAMPAFGAQFNDSELAAVLTFIRNEWGNNSQAVDASLVEKVRKETEQQTQPWAGEDDLLKASAPPSE
ncbi:c-type cytochrome [Eoetvoesiella caeni]|uniref:Mono/diheme cytochrome c family protein n=1 Tax=Eoetvoesiella caeni TaxID=645616 RepID=A0A366H0B6_9BURK|nr:cytochrome c [Eoetvoesiella caeni]MCI2811086.1 cytochrome c [Eoetvoesiella caeni]NYT57002.1 cytochrome c [Eoetvoesiella caeni]RBP35164.1 mono/diheme cytochrome c family protein [Eoetvoesiella caeni]